jgi:hypothetical protein
MAAIGKQGFATLADNTVDAPGRSDNQSTDSAGDNNRLVMEQLHFYTLEWTNMLGPNRSSSAGTRCAITRPLSTLPRLLHM